MDEMAVPAVDPKLCTLCGACVSNCPEHAVEMIGGELRFVDPNSCTYCGTCESVCPEGAIARTYVILWGAGASPSPE